MDVLAKLITDCLSCAFGDSFVEFARVGVFKFREDIPETACFFVDEGGICLRGLIFFFGEAEEEELLVTIAICSAGSLDTGTTSSFG